MTITKAEALALLAAIGDDAHTAMHYDRCAETREEPEPCDCGVPEKLATLRAYVAASIDVADVERLTRWEVSNDGMDTEQDGGWLNRVDVLALFPQWVKP